MNNNEDWDLSSIICGCKTTTFINPSTTVGILPSSENLTTITTTTSSGIISPINSTPFSFNDFIFNQQNSSTPFAPLKSNDFINLENLMIKFNPTTHIPTPTTTNTLTTIITTSSSFTITTTATTIKNPYTTTSTTIPIHITPNIKTNVHVSNQNSAVFDFSKLIEQERLISKFNPTTSIPTLETSMPTSSINPTITNHTTITPITTTTTNFIIPTTTISTHTTTSHIIPTTTSTMAKTSVHGTSQYHIFSDFPKLIEKQHCQSSINNQVSVSKPIVVEIPTAHFEDAYNHPSIPPQPKRRKNDNHVALVCHVREDKLSKDQWHWRKYGQKSIKGTPHLRSYYKCSTFKDCSATKLVEKSKTKENTYVVTYRGTHNHQKPALIHNYIVGTSQNKSSELRLHDVGEPGSSSNFKTFDSPNEVMLHFNHPESNNTQVLGNHSKIPHPEIKLIESESHVDGEGGLPQNKSSELRLHDVGEPESSSNFKTFDSPNEVMLHFNHPESNNTQVLGNHSKIPHPEIKLIESESHVDGEGGLPQNGRNLDPHDMMMLQVDKPETINVQVFGGESEIPYSNTDFIDDDDILIPNISTMLEDFLLDFNNLNGGTLFP